jgi:hypothetical protein
MRGTIESEPRHFTIFQRLYFGSLRKLRVQSGNKKALHNEISTILKAGRQQQQSGRRADDNPSWGRGGLQACSQVRRLAHDAALLCLSGADQIADYDESGCKPEAQKGGRWW